MQEDLITVKEAATELKVTPQCIHKWIKGGLLEAVRIGPRLIRIRRADLDKVFSSIGNKDKTITTIEAAAQLGITSRHTRRLIDDGKLKAEKIKGDWHITQEDLNTYKNNQNR